MTTPGVVNAAQFTAWNGRQGEHWVRFQRDIDDFLRPFATPLLDAAEIEVSASALDVGCGCGGTTRIAAKRAPRAEVVGIDLSAPMLDRAAELAASDRLKNVRFQQADAQVARFAEPFDVAFSRFGVMGFNDPRAAFANLRSALRPNGRLTFVCWQARSRNEWIELPAAALAELADVTAPLPDDAGPFCLSDPEVIDAHLSAAGFTGITIEPLSVRVALRGPIQRSRDILLGLGPGQTLLESLPAEAREASVSAIDDCLRAIFAREDTARLRAAAWLVVAAAL